jgi:PAS domain S-box-containing protein
MSTTYPTLSETTMLHGGAVVDRTLHLIELDAEFAALLGDTAENLLGQPVGVVLPASEHVVREVLADGQPRGPLVFAAAQGRTGALQFVPMYTARATIIAVELLIVAERSAPLTTAAEGPLQSPPVRAVLDGLFAFAGVLLPDGTLIEANRTALTAAGLVPEDVVGRPFEEAFWWSYDPAIQAQLRTAITRVAQGETVRYDVLVRLADDHFVTLDFMLAPAHDEQGRVQYLIPSAIDVTARKAVEKELRFQSQLLDAVGQGVIATDIDGTINYWNRFAEQLYGWTHAEALGRSVFDLTVSSAALEQGQAIMAQLQAGESWSGRYMVRRRDGSVFPAFVTNTPIYGPEHTVVGIVGISTDISEQQRQQSEREQLLQREQVARAAAEATARRLARLQALTDALAEALTLNQMEEVIVNAAVAALRADAGLLRLVDTDGGLHSICGSADLPAELLKQWAQTPIETVIPVSNLECEGHPLFFSDYATMAAAYPAIAAQDAAPSFTAYAIAPLSIEGRSLGSLALAFGEPQNFASEDRDLLLAMASQAAQAIERARLYEALREALEARDSFIAIASHDLRAPLTALLGQAQLLERRIAASPPEQMARRTRLIIEQAQRLNRMIDALLDVTRIQSGQLTINAAPLDLAALAARVIAELQPTLHQHQLELVGVTELLVCGDELRLEQVIYNLIGNAIKYSPFGGAIRVELVRQAAEALLSIHDQGIGIPAAALPRLFERYYRAPNAGVSGMGIGLYAVRKILALHGGAISVTSVEGVGSSFMVRLPLAG